MVELALTLMDYLIKFLQKREDNLDEYFENYVQPAYNAAELVYADYLSLFQIIKNKIEQDEQPIELIKFLEEGRIKYLPIRTRIRAEIFGRYESEFNHRDARSSLIYDGINREIPTWNSLPEFERGILGILMGGLSPFEDAHHISTPYSYGSHTLLDILYAFSSYAIKGEKKERYLRVINKQLSALKAAWEDVVSGYVKYKILVTPMPAKIKHYKRQGD